MNWSASIAQLVCIALMTILRALIRRGLIEKPDARELTEHHEIDWLALRIAKADNLKPLLVKNLDDYLAWEILTNDNNIACVGSWGPRSSESDSGSHAERAQNALKIRQRLGQLTNWAGPASTLSIAVADSIEIVLNTLFKETDNSEFTWSLKVKIGGTDDNHGKIHFTVKKRDGTWETDATYIEAALSLWLFHIRQTEKKSKTGDKTEDMSNTGDDWLRRHKSLERKIIRLLGHGKSDILQRDLKWWIRDIDESKESSSVPQGSRFAGPVGFVGVEPNGCVGVEPNGEAGNKGSGKIPFQQKNIILISQF